MQYVVSHFTRQQRFFGGTDPIALIRKYGSPLYVYSERVLRERCRELRGLLTYPRFEVNYSAKANGNLSLLRIVREEGLRVDAISPGELCLERKAGFRASEILYVCNNVSAEELSCAVEAGVLVSVDSVSQLEMLGRINRGGRVSLRFNPAVGAGHHAKVITGGENTKFGIERSAVARVKEVLAKYRMRAVGINQHIGSLFMSSAPYTKGAEALLDIAAQFAEVEFVDLGGGFGIPYHKADGEARLDLRALGRELDRIVTAWTTRHGRQITVMVEPGRYVVAECGVLLGTVHSVKENAGRKYAGTDIGFNVLMRPILYDSYHELEVYRSSTRRSVRREPVTVVGNICETGDIIAKDRMLPRVMAGDVIGVLDAGAYGYAMSSNYNGRLRPAEVLIREDGGDVLIRKADALRDLTRGFC